MLGFKSGLSGFGLSVGRFIFCSLVNVLYASSLLLLFGLLYILFLAVQYSNQFYW